MAKKADKAISAASAAELLYNAAAGDCISMCGIPETGGSAAACSAIAAGATIWAGVFAASGKSNDLFGAWTTAFRNTARRALPLEPASYKQAANAALKTLENWLDFTAAAAAGQVEAEKAKVQDDAAQAATIASLQRQLNALIAKS